jgi:hypothetical protein
MKKEILFAILIGLVMGLFITYGIYHSQRSSEVNQTTSNIEELNEVTPTTDPQKNGKLTLYSPEDESIIAESSIQVTGKTLPNSFIVVFVNNEPVITQADETGNFSKNVELETLANVITVHAVDEDGVHYSTQRTVIVYADDLTPQSVEEQNTEDKIEESVEEEPNS